MKIGILTHPLDYNYGCLLQAFALQKTIREMGHEVVTINRYSDPHRPFKVLLKDWIHRLKSRIIKHQDVSLCWNPIESLNTKRVLSSKTQLFVDRNIVNTGIVLPKDLNKIDEEYKFDAYVVGSDQVWLPHFSLNCFLNFVQRDNVKRIFYAASTGAQSFADNPLILQECRELAKKFSGFSVREDNLIPLVKTTLNREAIQVLDPTLLLSSQDYLKTCNQEIESEPVIFTYILDKTGDKQLLIEKIASKLNLPIVRGSVGKDYVKGSGMNIHDCIYPPVEKWISNLSRAKFVVTDSFHGTCMSIVFRKPFVVFGNESRGLNRFLSLLRLFDMEGRLILKSSEFNDSFYKSIDTVDLDNRIKELQSISISYLQKNLQ